MTLGGWFLMIVAVGGVTTLTTWCVYKVLVTPGATGHVHSRVDIGTPDAEEE